MKKVAFLLVLAMTSILANTPHASVPFCKPKAISAVGQFEGAAGNSIGTFTLTNISSQPCKVMGHNQLILQYPLAVNNIKVVYTNKAASRPFILSPQQSISASVHYPNGPQCNSALDYPDVMFSYDIAPHSNIAFMNGSTTRPFTITTCRSPKDITVVKISPYGPAQRLVITQKN